MSHQPKSKQSKSSQHLYHLTSIENLAAILRTGLKANEEGAIYAFTDLIVANTIACNQVFAAKYAIFKIAKRGVTGQVLPDDVAEFSSPYQRTILQEQIEPKHLRHLCTCDAIHDRPTEWDYHVEKNLFHRNVPQVDEEFAIFRWIAEETRAGRNCDEISREANERLARLAQM